MISVLKQLEYAPTWGPWRSGFNRFVFHPSGNWSTTKFWRGI